MNIQATCARCLMGEFADDDSEGIETQITRSGLSVAHIERPSGSFGTGSPWGILIRAKRGRQTYCGMKIDDRWFVQHA